MCWAKDVDFKPCNGCREGIPLKDGKHVYDRLGMTILIECTADYPKEAVVGQPR